MTAKLGISFGAGIVMGAVTMLAGLVLGLVLVAVKVHSCVTFGGVAAGHVAGGVLGALGPVLRRQHP